MSDSNAASSAPAAASQAGVQSNAAPVSQGQQSNQQAQTQQSGGQQQAQALPTTDAPKNYTIKVDGEEVSLSEDEIKKYASLGKGAQKRFEEAAVIRKENESMKSDIDKFFSLLKENPLAILEDESLGLDVKKIAETLMNKELEKAKKSPEQIEKEGLQKQLEKAQKMLKDAEEAKKKEEWEKLQNQAAANIEHEIMDALETKELPKSPYVVNRMVAALHLAAQNKISLTAKEVLPIVKKWIIDDMKGMTGLLPEDQLEAILGEDKIRSLRRRYIQKVKNTPSAKDVKSTGGDVKSAQDKRKSEAPKVNAKDFFKRLGRS